MSKYFAPAERLGRHTIFGNIPIVTLAGDHLQVAYVDLPADGVVDWHSHINEQMGVVMAGKLRFQIGDEDRILSPGDLYWIPGGVKHRVTPIDGPAKAIDVFYPIRDEYR